MGVFNFMESFFFISLGITFLLIIMLVYHFKQRIIALEHKHDTMFEIVNNIVKQLRNMQTNIQHLGEPTPFIMNPPAYIPHQPVFEPIQTEVAEVVTDDESDDETETSESDDDESDDKTETSESDEEEDEPVEITSFDEIPKENIHVPKCEEPSVQEDDIIIRKSDESISGLDETPKPTDFKDKYKKMTLAALKTAALEKGLATDASKMKKPELLKLLEADNE